MADLQTFPGKVAPAVEVSSSVGHYGVRDHMRTGFANVKSELISTHPLEASEKNFLPNQEKLEFKMLRNTQGLQAPLKLQMERAMASKIQRLPCLPSSMIALDTLMGTDECIGFEDFLNGVFIDVYYCSTCCFLCRSSTQNSDVDNLSFRA
ncbi:proteasome maturation protein-like isoform X1 [Acropora millepora]|uniref:proteasome maturation protein-like isoform X1 n=1 Tax=Acropora millepora TaxID=45264 RepID=UPI001CF4A9DF|nr:proteasome maturation protein-like isoform X1 [Acropora millepora]